MQISEAFPSKYLRADDVDEDLRVHMENIDYSEDPQIEKPLLSFKELDKPLVLNRTNAKAIAAEYGDDTKGWIGQPVILFTQQVTFEGRTAPAIRVRVPKRKSTAAAKTPVPQKGGAGDLDDSIPF